MGHDDLRSELGGVLNELQAHLKYLEGIGVSYVEEIPQVPEILKSSEIPSAVAESSSISLSEAMSPAVGTLEPPGTVMPTFEFLRQEEEMPPRKTRKPVEQQTLFGDIEARPFEPAQPQDRTLEDIRADVGDCTRCKLCQSRTTIVFGEGSPQARIMFVGEGPGVEEDAQARPFVGRAGQLLTRMIEAIRFKREDVYITNVIMCRAPGNRTPEPDEIATCEPFLFRKIRVIKPDIVVALGAIAAQSLLRTKAPISQIRGTFFDAFGIKVLPTFHPAFLLRSPERKKESWEDLKKIQSYVHSKSER